MSHYSGTTRGLLAPFSAPAGQRVSAVRATCSRIVRAMRDASLHLCPRAIGRHKASRPSCREHPLPLRSLPMTMPDTPLCCLSRHKGTVFRVIYLSPFRTPPARGPGRSSCATCCRSTELTKFLSEEAIYEESQHVPRCSVHLGTEIKCMTSADSAPARYRAKLLGTPVSSRDSAPAGSRSAWAASRARRWRLTVPLPVTPKADRLAHPMMHAAPDGSFFQQALRCSELTVASSDELLNRRMSIRDTMLMQLRRGRLQSPGVWTWACSKLSATFRSTRSLKPH